MLLEALDAVASDGAGEAPVWMEMDPETGAIILRAVDGRTGQRAVAWMRAYAQAEERWCGADEWERDTVRWDTVPMVQRRGCIKRKEG